MEKIYNDYSRDGIEIHTDNFRDDSLLRAGLKLNHLRMIVTIEDHGQISAAAEALNISQPAASRMLSEMEAIVEDAALRARRPRRRTDAVRLGAGQAGPQDPSGAARGQPRDRRTAHRQGRLGLSSAP